MDRELRHAAVVALVGLGRGDDHQDRADAGHGLARFADLPEARDTLLELVLDPDDTHVTEVTAYALLRRRDRTGLAIVAAALAVADENHADWIHTAIGNAFAVYADERDAAVRLCAELSKDADDRVARGARRLRESLAEIDPVLYPA